MRPKCIHEMDVVRTLREVDGWREPSGEPVVVRPGTQGTVVLHNQGADWVEVEVVESDGYTSLMFSAARDDLDVVHRYVPTR